MCDAEYFFWSSGHDLRHETFISRCVEILDNDASVVLCYPLARWLEDDNKLGEVFLDYVDTRGLEPLSALNTVLWGFRSACPVYGIMRARALKETRLVIQTVAADRILLAELCLLGAVALVPEPLLYCRRLPDWGDMEKYLVKCIGEAGLRQPSLYLWLKWICAFIGAVNAHIKSRRNKFFCALLIIICTHTKYRWFLQSLRHR